MRIKAAGTIPTVMRILQVWTGEKYVEFSPVKWSQQTQPGQDNMVILRLQAWSGGSGPRTRTAASTRRQSLVVESGCDRSP